MTIRVVPIAMIRRLRSLITGSVAAVLLGTLALPAGGQQRAEERVVAEVNDQAISSSDLFGRLQLAIISSGLPDSQETRQRLLPQVLRLLIDETLQLQEARKLEVRITDQEIDAEMEQLAQRNRMTGDQFRGALEQSGVPLSTMRQQIRANIAWAKLVQRRLRPTIQVGDEEIEAYSERIKANAGKPEYLVSEIFLAVDRPESEGEALQLADQLVGQIAGGANFGAVAQQFSQSAGAALGGDLGWVQQGQLEPALDTTVQQMRSGQFSRPIRGSAGYHILWVRDQRTVTAGNPDDIQVAIGQLVLPVPTGTDPAPVVELANRMVQEVASCDALQSAAAAVPGANHAAIPPTRMGDIPQALSGVVGRMGVGQPSQPLVTDVGVMILMVCDRVVPPGSLPPRDQIQNVLGLEKLEMLQRRYLRDLRRNAFVDVRI